MDGGSTLKRKELGPGPVHTLQTSYAKTYSVCTPKTFSVQSQSETRLGSGYLWSRQKDPPPMGPHVHLYVGSRRRISWTRNPSLNHIPSLQSFSFLSSRPVSDVYS